MTRLLNIFIWTFHGHHSWNWKNSHWSFQNEVMSSKVFLLIVDFLTNFFDILLILELLLSWFWEFFPPCSGTSSLLISSDCQMHWRKEHVTLAISANAENKLDRVYSLRILAYSIRQICRKDSISPTMQTLWDSLKIVYLVSAVWMAFYRPVDY